MDSKNAGYPAESVAQQDTAETRNTGGCPAPRRQPFCLNQWLIRPDSNELISLRHLELHNPATYSPDLIGQQRRSLEPRLMHLLCLLAAAPQRVFSRDELMSHLWPRVIVNENSLTRAVSELRKQLVHPGSDARLIDTIPKTGYRLNADSRVCEYEAPIELVRADSSNRAASGPVVQNLQMTRASFSQSSYIRSARGLALAASLAVTAALLTMVQLPASIAGGSTPESGIALADINLSSQADLDALLDGRLETVAAQSSSQNGATVVAIDSLDSSNPVISRDGGLFAYVRYHDQGSSLILGSTRLPSSPVTVFTTEDSIYNLQWSPVDRALLFAQSPRITPAALLPQEQQASLVLFDLDSFSTKVLFGPGHDAPGVVAPGSDSVEDNTHKDSDTEPRSFKLTALSHTLDWLS